MSVSLNPVPLEDRRILRNLLGQFATGVTVITSRAADGRKIGLTANSFTSVSLDPPLILWCLNRTAGSASDFLETPKYAIHVLAEEQEQISRHFAKPAADKFAELPHGECPDGVPLLPGAVATLLCRSFRHYEAGDHLIFVGEIEHFELAGGDPLIFHAGSYRSAAPHHAQDGASAAG